MRFWMNRYLSKGGNVLGLESICRPFIYSAIQPFDESLLTQSLWPQGAESSEGDKQVSKQVLPSATAAVKEMCSGPWEPRRAGLQTTFWRVWTSSYVPSVRRGKVGREPSGKYYQVCRRTWIYPSVAWIPLMSLSLSLPVFHVLCVQTPFQPFQRLQGK